MAGEGSRYGNAAFGCLVMKSRGSPACVSGAGAVYSRMKARVALSQVDIIRRKLQPYYVGRPKVLRRDGDPRMKRQTICAELYSRMSGSCVDS